MNIIKISIVIIINNQLKKKILILGASGFIGSNLYLYFKKKNYSVIGTYNNNYPKIVSKGKFFKCDLANYNQLKELKKKIGSTDILINAAAVTSGAKDIINNPHIHVNDNAIINSNITKFTFSNKINHIIMMSCSVMYPSSKKKLKETDFQNFKRIYPKYFGGAWMKIFMEKNCKFYSNLNSSKFTIVRHSNTYGPYDKYDLMKSHVFGATIAKTLNANNSVKVWGDGSEIRDFLYVEDLCKFIELAIKKQKNAYEIYNVGRGKGIKIKDLVKKVIKHSKKNLKLVFEKGKPTLKTNIVLDCSKAKKHLGWQPKTTLDEGIVKSINWYIKNINFK
jgi:nucleoside-diphosphate-sugar epimerase